MLITINKGPDNINMLEGTLLVVGNKDGVISIKVLDPEKDPSAGVVHFTPAEINWLIKNLPNIKEQPAEVGCSAFMDKSSTNKIPPSTIKRLIRGLC